MYRKGTGWSVLYEWNKDPHGKIFRDEGRTKGVRKDKNLLVR